MTRYSKLAETLSEEAHYIAIATELIATIGEDGWTQTSKGFQFDNYIAKHIESGQFIDYTGEVSDEGFDLSNECRCGELFDDHEVEFRGNYYTVDDTCPDCCDDEWLFEHCAPVEEIYGY
jgi:hypothetical protein